MQSKKKETVVQICRGKCPHYLGKKSVFVLARPIPRVAKPTLIRCHSSLSDFLDLQRFTIYIYQQVLQPSLLSQTQSQPYLMQSIFWSPAKKKRERPPNTTTTRHKKGVSGCSQHRVGDIFTSWLGWIHSPSLNWNTLEVDLPRPGFQYVFSSAMDHLLRPLMVFERPRLPINWTRQGTWTPLDWCESSLALNSKVLTRRPCLKIGLDLPDEDLQRI